MATELKRLVPLAVEETRKGAYLATTKYAITERKPWEQAELERPWVRNCMMDLKYEYADIHPNIIHNFMSGYSNYQISKLARSFIYMLTNVCIPVD